MAVGTTRANRLPYEKEVGGVLYVRLVVRADLLPFANGEKNLYEPMGSTRQEAKRNHARALVRAQDRIDAIRARKAEADGIEAVRAARIASPMTDDEMARDLYRSRLELDEVSRAHPAYSSMGIDDGFVADLRRHERMAILIASGGKLDLGNPATIAQAISYRLASPNRARVRDFEIWGFAQHLCTLLDQLPGCEDLSREVGLIDTWRDAEGEIADDITAAYRLWRTLDEAEESYFNEAFTEPDEIELEPHLFINQVRQIAGRLIAESYFEDGHFGDDAEEDDEA